MIKKIFFEFLSLIKNSQVEHLSISGREASLLYIVRIIYVCVRDRAQVCCAPGPGPAHVPSPAD